MEENQIMISGRWVNKKNNEIVNVKDCVLDGENMQIITDKGIIDGDTFSTYYIQVSDDIYNEDGTFTGKKEDIDYDLLFKTNIQNESKQNQSAVPEYDEFAGYIKKDVDPKFAILDKFFEKIDDLPKIRLQLIWENIPTEELNMFKKFFDIDNNIISEYIFDKFFIQSEMKITLKEEIDKYIN